jgi:hypothetical protein
VSTTATAAKTISSEARALVAMAEHQGFARDVRDPVVLAGVVAIVRDANDKGRT